MMQDKGDYIDSHVHCGMFSSKFEEYLKNIKDVNIKGAVMFPPVSEIYDRIDKNFQDSEEWRNKREKANEYILSLVKNENLKVYPFFFVWNDFPIENLLPYLGVKWHRHSHEPKYEYDSEKCKDFVEEIRKRNLPVILEEEFENTLLFIDKLARKSKVIIPHCGELNGGYRRFCQFELWKKDNVYADTALADSWIIKDYIKRYGHERIIFGSDFPFGYPQEELEKILKLDISEEVKKAVTCLNMQKLLNSIIR